MSVKRILLVEDEPEIRAVLDEALRDKSYAVDFAGTVREAKGWLASQTYDLVIADWKLPDGDGRLIADWETWSFRPHAVNEPVSAIACRISS